MALVAAGGEHLSDLATLRAELGLRIMLGFKLSSPTQAKDFLYRFHQAEDGRLLTDEDDDVLSVRGKAQIRAEGPGLCALDAMVRRVVDAVQAIRPRTRATLDVDASIVEAHKKRALRAYEGTVGYQPQMALWAEQSSWVCDEFRDGNVPAELEIRAFLERAFASLPAAAVERRLRGDSALYNEDALSWVDDQDIQFVVSADMSPELTGKVTAIAEAEWQDYPTLNDKAAQSEERQWAEVPGFVPDWRRNYRADGEPFRYVAIRVRSRQRDLLELLKVQALPAELSAARPKTLRFCLFNLAGRLIHHARYWTLRVYRGLPFAEALGAARGQLVALARQLERGGSAAGG